VSPDVAAMVEFLRDRYAEKVATAREVGNMLITQSGSLTVSREAAEKQARRGAHAAEVRYQFLEETVVAYLGTAGPTGRIAEQQLRLLAWEHEGHRDYQPSWAPTA
jgi:hypothetical protein